MNAPARFIIRAHPFIDDALLIIDRAPTHRLADVRDWTKTTESIAAKVCREVEIHGASLSDAIAIIDTRTRKLERLLHLRRLARETWNAGDYTRHFRHVDVAQTFRKTTDRRA